MRRRTLTVVGVLCAALALMPQNASAEDLTVDEVVQKSIEAQGGETAWRALKSLEMRGSFSTFSQRDPFVLYRSRPDLYRFDFKYAGQDVTVAYDGDHAWWATEAVFSQVSWPVEAPVAHAQALESEAEFGSPLLDHRRKGHRIELIGKTDLDGDDTYQLEVQLENGSAETWHLDPVSFLPVARVSTGADSRMPAPQRTFFSDYREVAGVQLPHRLDIELGFRYQVMEVDEVRVNPPLTENHFALPRVGDMGRLAGLIGDWDVEVSSRPYPNMPWLDGQVAASLRPFFHGNLLEHEISYLEFGRWRHVKRQVSYDRFRDVFCIVLFDSLTSHLNVLEGRFEEGRLVTTNLDTGTTWEAKGQTYHTRESIYDIEADHFHVDWEVSTDGGKTWFATAKFRYRRQAPADDSPP